MNEKEKKEILDMIERKAVEAIIRDDTCARSTMHGLSCYFKFIPETMVAASWALTGGVAASSGSCGALCSSLLAIGARYFPTMDEVEAGGEVADKKMEKGLEKLFAYRDAFMKEFGSLSCPGVQKGVFGRSYNFLDEKEQEEFLTMEGHSEKCATVVGKAVRMAAEMILEDEEQPPD